MRTFLRRLAYLLLFLLSCVLVIWGFLLKDPHLLPYRTYETPGLLVLIATGLSLSLKFRSLVGRGLLIVLLSAALLLTLFFEGRFYLRQQSVLSRSDAEAQAIGSRFMVGYTNLVTLEPLIRKGLVGGVFLLQRNIRGKSAEEIRQEIATFQAIREEAGLPPLVIATDQEGGLVSRLSPPLEKQPPLADLTKTSNREERIRAARTYGLVQGTAMADLGFTVNFSPVVDLKIDHGPNALDFHSLISRRAISEDPAVIGEIALGYSQGLEQAGIVPTLKHFPGLGRVKTDTHHFSATLDVSRETLEDSDWLPYWEVIDDTNAWVMLAHVVVTDIDPETPASFSSKVVQGVLRDDWGFEGTLITDDLTMAAAYNQGLCKVTQKALDAGVDWLLIAYDADKYYDAMYCALETIRTDERE